MLTSAGSNNPSAQRPSGDKITDVNLTPSFSPPESDFSFKSSSVNNQENTDGSEDDKNSAPTIDEIVKPVKLRTNDWRKNNNKLSMTKLIMRRAVRRSNDLESPENSRTSLGDMDISSLVEQALERGKDIASKQAEKTVVQNPQETPTEDKNKLLEKAMLWKQKNSDPSYKAETPASWDTGTVFDGYSSEASQHSIEKDPEATSEPSHGGLEGMGTSVLQSTRPTSVTDVPYVTRPRPTPKLINLLMNAPTSVRQINPTEYLKSESSETEVELNLNNGESETTKSAKSDFGKPDMNLDFANTLSATAESSKSHSEKTEMDMDLPSTQSKTDESASSYSEKTEMNTILSVTQPTTAESAKSGYEKAEMNANLPTSQWTGAESTKSYSKEAEMKLNLAATHLATGDPGKSDLNLKSYEPPNYFGSGQSGRAEPNPKTILETPESSSSVDPQATPEDTAQETTKKGSSENNRESPFPHDQPRVSGQERSPQHGTSAIPNVDMNVHPKLSASSGLRWHVALERRDTNDNGKDKHSKTKKKKKHKSHSTVEDPADSGSPIIVGGIVGGIFMLMAIVTCFIQLW